MIDDLSGRDPVRSHVEEVRRAARVLEQEGRLSQCREFMQHGDYSVYDHVVNVALRSLAFADWLERRGVKVDRASLVRGALLHDYFLYDWHNPDPNDPLNLRGYTHPWTALRNAEQDFQLTKRERTIIVRHMFPLTVIPPTCREAWIVCMADKLCAVRETLGTRVPKRFLPRWLTNPEGTR